MSSHASNKLGRFLIPKTHGKLLHHEDTDPRSNGITYEDRGVVMTRT